MSRWSAMLASRGQARKGTERLHWAQSTGCKAAFTIPHPE
jgi:hypothetical protein